MAFEYGYSDCIRDGEANIQLKNAHTLSCGRRTGVKRYGRTFGRDNDFERAHVSFWRLYWIFIRHMGLERRWGT